MRTAFEKYIAFFKDSCIIQIYFSSFEPIQAKVPEYFTKRYKKKLSECLFYL